MVGRRVPTETQKNQPLYRMRIFAPDAVSARSRFWYFVKRLKKLKKTSGEICYCNVVSNTHTCTLAHTHTNTHVNIFLTSDESNGMECTIEPLLNSPSPSPLCSSLLISTLSLTLGERQVSYKDKECWYLAEVRLS